MLDAAPKPGAQAEPGVLLSSAPDDALEVGDSSEWTPRARAVSCQEERVEMALGGRLTFVRGPHSPREAGEGSEPRGALPSTGRDWLVPSGGQRRAWLGVLGREEGEEFVLPLP